jgi:hypothetical protein
LRAVQAIRGAGNADTAGPTPIEICSDDSEDSEHEDGDKPDDSAENGYGEEEDLISSSEDEEPIQQQYSKASAALRNAKDVIDLLDDDSGPEDEIEDEIEDDFDHLEVLLSSPSFRFVAQDPQLVEHPGLDIQSDPYESHVMIQPNCMWYRQLDKQTSPQHQVESFKNVAPL